MILQVPVMNKGPITPLMGVVLTTEPSPGMLLQVEGFPGFPLDFHDDYTLNLRGLSTSPSFPAATSHGVDDHADN